MLHLALAFSLVSVLASPAGMTVPGAGHSSLWGAAGQSYKDGGPLPDFSWAGYHGGEELPSAKVTASVRAFGAQGDGETDDTAAFQRALDEAPSGVLLIPRGHYRLAGQLNLTRSGLVLRGEGSGEGGSVLHFASSLADLQRLTTLPESNKLSWSGGLIQVFPKGSERKVTEVTSAARRGEDRLQLANAKSLAPGDLLFLRLTEDGQRSLERHLLDEAGPGQSDPAPLQSTCAARVLDWTFEVARVEGNAVVLSQPLRTDVRPSWAPTVWRMPVVREVGIEHLAIAFPSTPYPGHHRERGYNAVDFSHNVVHAWIRDVEVRNCDSGIFVGRRSKWLTLTQLRFVSSRAGDAKGNQGHHGVALSSCSDVLVADITFESELIHELTLTHRAVGNVLSGPVHGKRIDLDLHRDAPFENLFQQLSGDLHLQDSGSACYGPPSGVRNTYWALDPFSLPTWIGTAAVVVGDVVSPATLASKTTWIERVPNLQPRDLRAAQRLHRLERDKKGPAGAKPAESSRRPAGR
jgi:hypothetical protein